MKKICLFVLIIYIFQLFSFVPNNLVWATDDIDETNEMASIGDFDDGSDDCNNDESVGAGYSANSVINEYTEAGTPKNTYSSNIYQYDSFMESYFDNLTINHGDNTIGSCGYVAIDMLLCYYDTYLNDNIVPEQYDVPSESSCYNVICRRNSPGSMFDMPKGYSTSNYTDADGNVDESQRNIDYYNYIEKMEDVSLHARLLSLGDSLFSINLLNLTPGLNHLKIKQVIHKYMADVLGFSNGDEYEIRDINHSLNANKSDEVRDFVIEKVQLGNPVLVGLDDGEGGGHWVIAYDYDETTDKIYCNFGWGGDATHITPENCVEELKQDPEKNNNYYIYDSALVIDFNLPHRCSDNYVVIDSDGTEEYYCYCSENIEVYSNPLVSMSVGFYDHTYHFDCGCDFVQNHIDDFEAGESGHLRTCKCCGYERLYSHAFTHTSIDALQHSSKCTNESCEMEFTYNHNWTFVSVDGVTHTATCSDCGYTESQNHIMQYSNITSTHHTYGCTECGYSVTSEHDMTIPVPLAGAQHGCKCTECDYVDESTLEAHSYNSFTYVSDTAHRGACDGCGAWQEATSPHTFTMLDRFGRMACIGCGYTKYFGSDSGNIILSITKVSANGSYILPDGTIMLVDEDIEAYLNGTLVFYDKDNVPQVQ